MAKNQFYIAAGEEAARGTAESTTVGFIPVNTATFPTYEPTDEPVLDFRGEQTSLGDSRYRRNSEKWSAALDIPMFTEAGTTAAMMGTILKHFFGGVTSTQNSSTGQYFHMLYPVSDPFATGNLGTKALTLNTNITQNASTIQNHVFGGGRVSALTFSQSVGSPLQVSASFMGQQHAVSTAIATPSYAAENLLCDYDKLKAYFGAVSGVTRTGTAPAYTDMVVNDAVQFCPDSITVTIANGLNDKQLLCGSKYPTKTLLGKYTCTVEMTIDFEDPSSGFSSYDDFVAWHAGLSTISLYLNWDTGTTAGTGDNHQFGLDIPIALRGGGQPSISADADPTITLKYTAEMDLTTTQYMIGAYLKNTAATI